jgi:hypothetical protein
MCKDLIPFPMSEYHFNAPSPLLLIVRLYKGKYNIGGCNNGPGLLLLSQESKLDGLLESVEGKRG